MMSVIKACESVCEGRRLKLRGRKLISASCQVVNYLKQY